MFSASSFSKITTMTWSGVGTPAAPAGDAAGGDEDEAEEGVGAPAGVSEEQPVSMLRTRTTAAAAPRVLITVGSSPSGGGEAAGARAVLQGT
jgi:hypothetical protein